MTQKRITRGIGLVVLLVAAIALSSCGKKEPAKKQIVP